MKWQLKKSQRNSDNNTPKTYQKGLSKQMKKIRFIWVPALAVMVGMSPGCANKVAQISDADQAELSRSLECNGEVECNRLWRKAQAWVVQNAGYKIQAVSDAVVQTYNAPEYSTGWSMQLSRSPIDSKIERFNLKVDCGVVPLCRDSPSAVIARFRRQMRMSE